MSIKYNGKTLSLSNIFALQTKRATKLGISPIDRDDLYSVFYRAMEEGTCHYCGCKFIIGSQFFKPTLDHKTPLSKGGKNDIDNLVVCCIRCNMLKRTIDYDSFVFILSKMGDYIRYADSPILRNRFSNRFKELKSEYLITGR